MTVVCSTSHYALQFFVELSLSISGLKDSFTLGY